MSKYRDVRDRGGLYLLDRQHPDGGFGDPSPRVTEYYKVITAFQVCGHTNEASRLCRWVRSHGLTADGDFGPRPDHADAYYYAYFNSWVVTGAHRLGQFDLSERGMEFIMDFWDPESGGFFSSPTEREGDTLQDLWVVGGCGLAALCTGRIDVARGVGRWMRRVMRAQPDYPRQLYSVYSLEGGLLTEPDPADEVRYVMTADAQRDQYFFHPGIAGGFLARLYQATGEETWLDLAREYMAFAEGASDFLFHLLRAGKVGWAASVLYTLTGEESYLAMARRVGDNIVEAQLDDGSWSAVGTDTPSNDSTAEMVVWLDEIHQAAGHM